ncbi:MULTISPECIES: Rap1a/Tai family immunity protein [unclassified Nitrospina]|uniref:Rap1a/Tai family immunity protein n=1 Tax=unclassified Nitrospina TaxID=2638683 RepID=UPI003F97938F
MRIILVIMFFVVVFPSKLFAESDYQDGWGLLEMCSFDEKGEALIRGFVSMARDPKKSEGLNDIGLLEGKKLLLQMDRESLNNLHLCIGYLYGAAEALGLWRATLNENKSCKSITVHDLRNAVIKYLRDNPEYLKASRIFSVIGAYNNASPCEISSGKKNASKLKPLDGQKVNESIEDVLKQLEELSNPEKGE